MGFQFAEYIPPPLCASYTCERSCPYFNILLCPHRLHRRIAGQVVKLSPWMYHDGNDQCILMAKMVRKACDSKPESADPKGGPLGLNGDPFGGN